MKSGKKALYVIADGLGDRPVAALGNLTPSEYAATPALDSLCRDGMAGLVHPYRPGCRVGTDWGHICLFGYEADKYYTGRGAVEAFSAGMDMRAGDVAFRGNIATVDENLTVLDRRAGRIKNKADIKALLQAVDGYETMGAKVHVRSLTEHRIALVIRGADLKWSIADTDPGTACEGRKVISPLESFGEEKSARVLWQFLLYVNKTWESHPVNLRRIAEGLLPANFILTRGAAAAMTLPPIGSLFGGISIGCIAGDRTITGIGRMCGFSDYVRESFTGGFSTDYLGKAKLALECLSKHDLVIVHIKGTDLCGHDDKPEKKAEIIEHIDGMFAYWLSHIDENTYLAMASDHSTPCHFRDHSADPVPAFLWGSHVRRDACLKFGERDVAQGMLSGYTGREFMYTILDFLGYTKKYGA